MKRIFSIFFLALLLFSCEQSISEFQSENFLKYFGSGYESRGYDVIQLADGSYVLTGYDQPVVGESQIFVAKTDENGNEIWAYAYGAFDTQEVGKVIKKVSDGFIIAGTSVKDENNAMIHSFIMKIGVDGDSLWHKEFENDSINIEVNDILVDDESIIVAGHFFESNEPKTGFYRAKLSLNDLGYTNDWETITYPGTSSTFKKVILIGSDYLFVGDAGLENKIFLARIAKDNGILYSKYISEIGESVADAKFENNQLYILANAQSYTKILRISTDFDEQWQTEAINSISGKTLTYSENGMLLVLGETLVGGNTLINSIEVDDSGAAEYGENSFRTIQGSIENLKFTADKGFIMIGSTNKTFGIKLQLIKTDRDLFLLRP